MTRTLILGGARSGKSAHIASPPAPPAPHGITVEPPLALGDALRHWCAPGRVVLVDCLTLWLSNLMLEGDEQHLDVDDFTLPAQFDAERADFLAALDQVGSSGGELILVSNEVGMGIVPWGALSRRFADEAGRLNQAVAASCDRALLIVAGWPVVLKGSAC